MTADAGLVYVVDDEAAVRTVTTQILKSAGFITEAFASVDEVFLSAELSLAECIVTDLRMPGADGTEILRRLRIAGNLVSVVYITGHADIRTVVRLMEDGALTLLEKPYDPQELVSVVKRAVEKSRQSHNERAALQEAQRRLAQLDAEAREVMRCMIAGMSNKAIVAKLQLSARTLDRRKQSIFSLVGVGSISELSALVTRLESAAIPQITG